jgi:hypothetical protein
MRVRHGEPISPDADRSASDLLGSQRFEHEADLDLPVDRLFDDPTSIIAILLEEAPPQDPLSQIAGGSLEMLGHFEALFGGRRRSDGLQLALGIHEVNPIAKLASPRVPNSLTIGLRCLGAPGGEVEAKCRKTTGRKTLRSHSSIHGLAASTGEGFGAASPDLGGRGNSSTRPMPIPRRRQIAAHATFPRVPRAPASRDPDRTHSQPTRSHLAVRTEGVKVRVPISTTAGSARLNSTW